MCMEMACVWHEVSARTGYLLGEGEGGGGQNKVGTSQVLPFQKKEGGGAKTF